MPLQYNSGWNEASADIHGLGNQLSALAYDLSRQRYGNQIAQQQLALRALQEQSQAALNIQHGKAYDQQVLLDKAREMVAMQDAKAAAQRAYNSEALGVNLGERAKMTTDIGRAAFNPGISEYSGKLAGAEKSFNPKDIAQIMGFVNEPERQAIATGTHSVIPMAPNSSTYNVISGKVGPQAPGPVNAGASMYNPVTGRFGAQAPGNPAAFNPANTLGATANALRVFKDPITGEMQNNATVTNLMRYLDSIAASLPSSQQKAIQNPGDKEADRAEGLKRIKEKPYQAKGVRELFRQQYGEEID